jgi:methionyl-tRNA formyltransferase
MIREWRPDSIISYGYRHIIKKDVLSILERPIINLHISYLPWNRGADPNFWSLLENTPRGVTIHYIDEGIDTGDIIAQEEVVFAPDDTLATSYRKLQETVQDLFKAHCQSILNGTVPCVPQKEDGSFHRSKDKEAYAHLLIKGWDTPIAILESYVITKKDQ